MEEIEAEVEKLLLPVASTNVEEPKWTLFRVPSLGNGEVKRVTGTYTGTGQDGMFLTRSSIAEWVLQEMREGKWIGKTPVFAIGIGSGSSGPVHKYVLERNDFPPLVLLKTLLLRDITGDVQHGDFMDWLEFWVWIGVPARNGLVPIQRNGGYLVSIVDSGLKGPIGCVI